MKISTKFELEDGKVAVRNCHWCREELHGLLAEFVHCVRCNERRITEGLDHTFDPCPICMTWKAKQWEFLSFGNKRNGEGIHD